MAAQNVIIDARLDVKVAQFSGRDEDWFLWCLRFEAYTSLLGWQGYMETARDLGTEVRNEVLAEEAGQVSLGLFNLLVTKCEGKAMGIIRATRRGEGLECWRP